VRRIHTEEIKEGNTIPPAQKEKSARQYKNHRQNVHHKIYVEIARCILRIRDKHFTRMLREFINAVCVKAHKRDRNVLAKPSEKFQNPSAIPIAMSHQQIHNLTDIFVFQPL
jgi:hypothetical protein